MEQLCRCGHLTSDHEIVAVWTAEQLARFGSPCNRCNADHRKEERKQYGRFCTGFSEWPIDSLPYPGTYDAKLLGCVCPVEVNVRRAAEKLPPVMWPECPVHQWTCQQTTICEHELPYGLPTAIDHRVADHYACEHCTVPVIVCENCQKVWNDWRIWPTIVGWVETAKAWRCETCQQK